MRIVRMFLASLAGSITRPGVNGLWLAAAFLLIPSTRAQGTFGGLFQFTTNRFVATEAEGTAFVTVTRNSDFGKMMVDVVASNGTATNGTDFKIHSSGTNLITLTFNHLQNSITFPVTIANNSLSNAGGQMLGNLALTNVRAAVDESSFITGGVARANGTSQLVIFDDDVEMQFNFERLLTITPEPNPPSGSTVNLTVKLAKEPGDGSQGVEVDYEVRVGPYGTRAGSDFAKEGADFEPITGTLQFGANDNQQTISINITNDTELEFNEDFHVILTAARGTVTIETPPATPDGMPTTEEKSFALGRAIVATVTIGFNASATQPQPAGALDEDFNPDNPAKPLPGANDMVLGVAVDARTNTVIVGDFRAVNAVSRNRIARLDMNGELDLSFAPTSGANDFVSAVAVYTNGVRSGQILVGGGFTALNGVQRIGIGRLNSDGSTDLSFDPGTGANGPVYAISLQKDGGILVGGDFTLFNGIPRNRLVRLLPDGSVDLNFVPGTGANGAVLAIQSLSADPVIFSLGSTNGAITTTTRTIPVGAQSGFLTLTYNFRGESNDLRVIAGSTNYYSGIRFNEQVRTNDTGGTITNYPSTVVSFPFVSVNSNVTVVVNVGGTNEATNWFYTVEIQPDKTLGLLVGGDFTTFNGIEHGGVAKLGNNGSVDTNFNLGTGIGADAAVSAIAIQRGQPVLGGSFRSFNGLRAGGVVRLNTDGSVDRNFVTGSGADDGTVNTLVVDSSDRILAGGSFTTFNQTRRVFLTRLLTNGPVDTSFLDPAYNQYAGFPNPTGLAPIGFLSSIALDQMGNVLVGGSFSRVGGGFTRTDVHPRNNIARLNGGSNTNRPGNIEFLQPLFGADENAGTLGVTLRRVNGALGSGQVSLSTLNGSAISTNDFVGITNRPITWGTAGPMQSDGVTGPSIVQITINDDTIIEGDEQFALLANAPRSTFTLGGEFIPAGLALGAQVNATGAILENDVPASTVEFSQAQYSADERGSVTIAVNRTGNLGSSVTVRYSTVVPTNGNPATAGVDYLPISNGLITFQSGQTNKTFTITLNDDEFVEQDETVLLVLSQLTPGAVYGTNATATLNIIDNDYQPGRVNLSAANYSVSEGAGPLEVNVTRTGGSVGVLQVNYRTVDDTATAPFDYSEATGTLTWNDGDSLSRTIRIPINEDGQVEGSERFRIELISSNPAEALGLRTNSNVTIVDNDTLGSFAFNAAEFLADENGSNVVINVVRRGGSAEQASVEFFTTNLTAQAGTHYVSTNGTLSFGVGETSKSFVVPIIDNTVQNSNRIFRVVLRNPQPAGASLGLLTNITVTIVDNETQNIPAGSVEANFANRQGADATIQAMELMPDGQILIGGDFMVVDRQVRTRLARLRADGTLDPSFGTEFNIDNSVRAIELLGDGRIIIAGTFTNINGLPARGIARISSSGSVDTTFNTGAGADNPVFAAAETFVGNTRKILIGGSFSVYNGVPRRGIARVNEDGRADTAFNPGSGVNGTVYAIKVQRDGKVLVGGDFTTVAGVPRINIARLNADGTLDTSFDPGLGADDSVRSIEIQFDDKILIGGLFESVSSVSRGHVARLNIDGSLDATFQPGTGANAAVYALALQSDGKIVVAGDFTRFNGVLMNRIVRLNPDGAIDPSINFGTGANAFIGALAIQPDRRILIAGGFTEFDGFARGRYARLFGGSLSGSGALEFAAADTSANEAAGEVTVRVRRTGGLFGTVSVNYGTASGSASGGVDYTDVNGTLTFAPGENSKTFTIPLLDDNLAETAEAIALSLSNPTGGAALGNQPIAVVTIVSDDSVVSFSDLLYTVNETAPGGRAVITLVREGENSFPVSVTFSATAGTATPGQDFTAVNTVVTIPAGQNSAVVAVPILEDSTVEDNETVLLRLSSPSSGGLLGRPSATLVILDNDFAPGILSVLDTAPVAENAGSVGITVVRRFGRTGQVSVRYAVRNGTATAGEDFVAGNGTLSFQEGETTKTFPIQILDDTKVEGNETIQIELFEPSGGATVQTRFTSVLILDDDFGPGSLDTTFNVGSGASGPVRDIDIQADGKVLVGGEFDLFNDNFVGGVARLDVNGAIDSAFSAGGGAAGSVFSLTPMNDGRIAVAGDFSSIGGVLRRYVGRLLTNGFADANFATQAGENGRVLAVEAQSNGKLIVGGEFTTPARYVMRLNTDGTLDVSFSPDGGTDGPVRDIAIQADGRILIGGNFSRVGSSSVRGIARLMPNGLIDSSFAVGTGVNGTVNAILVQPDGDILIAGDFTTVNGTARSRIARLNPNGSLDASFNLPVGPNSAINAIALVNGKIYLGGNFTTVGGVARTRVARLNFDGTLDPAFDPGIGPDAAVYAIAGQRSGQVLIGGAFNTVNGFPTPGIARLNGDKTAPTETRITNMRVTDNTVQFTFSSQIGTTYVIQGSEDLITWSTVDTRVASSASTNFSTPVTSQHKFYRILVNP